MSKTPKKTAKAPAKKAKTAKPKLKAVKAKAAPKAKAKMVAQPHGSRRGFMWKVLELKQQKQKEKSSVIPAGEAHENPHAHAQDGFGRFNGPRRRVG